MTAPVRIQLSRKKGFNLQERSLSVNGLPAVNVARPSRWGNPYSVKACGRRLAVQYYRELYAPTLDVSELRGKNLACFCGPLEECHADVLIEIANAVEGSDGE